MKSTINTEWEYTNLPFGVLIYNKIIFAKLFGNNFIQVDQ